MQIVPFPHEVILGLKEATKETLAELTDGDAISRKVFEHYENYRNTNRDWMMASEKQFYDLML